MWKKDAEISGIVTVTTRKGTENFPVVGWYETFDLGYEYIPSQLKIPVTNDMKIWLGGAWTFGGKFVGHFKQFDVDLKYGGDVLTAAAMDRQFTELGTLAALIEECGDGD